MIPILFDQSVTTFDNYGLGALSDCLSCIVTEERNGIFEAELTYPINGIHFSDIKENNIVLAKPSDSQNPQAFRIYKITDPINGIVTISAEHISYELRFIPVTTYTAQDCNEALSKIKTNSLVTNPFNFHTDKSTQAVYNVSYPKSARSILGGAKESILEVFKGEYKWDNYDVYLLNSRGSDKGVTLRYGKNITDFKQITDLSDTVTGILPYWKSGIELVIGDITRIETDLPYERIETLDISSLIEVSSGDIPTKAQVTAAGAKALNDKSYVGVPSVNFNISFIDLAQTEEYKDIAPLEKVDLCDTVTIIFERFNLSTKAKVIKTVYDCLMERYNNIEIGDTYYSLTNTVAAQENAVKESNARIEVLDEQIVLKVNKGDVSSQLSVETGKVTLSSNRLIVNSTNFTLDENGNAKFRGTISGSILQGGSITTSSPHGTISIGDGALTARHNNNETIISSGYIQTNYRIVCGVVTSGNAHTIMDADQVTVTTGSGNYTMIKGGQIVMINDSDVTSLQYIKPVQSAEGNMRVDIKLGNTVYQLPTTDWVRTYHTTHIAPSGS